MIKHLKKRWYLFILIFIVAGAVFYFRKNIVKSQTKKENVHLVKRQTLTETLSIAGQIEAEEKATLKFQTSGLLSWVGVKKGDRVKKFQGIASLDRRELEKNLKKYLNTFLGERWDLDQTKEDYKNKAITDAMQRIIDKAQFDLNNAILDVEIKNLALQLSYLSTPIEGIVTKIDSPYPGVNITAAGAEFEVVNPNTVYFSANADQTEVIKLKEKMKGIISLDAYPEKNLKGEIYFISFSPKQGETGTVYEIKLKFNNNNSDYKYKLGMTGDVSFDTAIRKDALAIPSTYIKSENGKKYVWKDSRGKKVKTYVTLGEEIDSDTIIISGLNEGERVYD